MDREDWSIPEYDFSSTPPPMIGKAEPFRLEDLILLELAKQVCLMLSQEKRIPRRGFWCEKVPSDQCWVVRNDLLLPMSLRGKLNLEEWRPLLTSSLVFQANARARRRRNILQAIGWNVVFMMPMLALIVFSTLYKYPIGTFPGIPYGLAFLVASYIILIPAGARRIPRLLERAVLESDMEASRLVGRESLVESFRKIDDLGLKDIERLKGRRWTAYVSGRLSITRRIQNLLEA